MASPCICFWLSLHHMLVSGAPSAKIGKKWWTVGPFASGKTEYDGDPLVPLGGIRTLFERGPGSKSGYKSAGNTFLAEHARGGRLSWTSVNSDSANGLSISTVQLPYQHIPFQQLMEKPPLAGQADIMHVQYWVVGSILIKRAGRFGVDCPGLHTFSVALSGSNASGSGPAAGNIYHRQRAGAASVDFPEVGRYNLYARVRGKVPLSFSCGLKPVDPNGELVVWTEEKNFPDVVRGGLIAGPSAVDLRVKNLGGSWLDITTRIRPSPTVVQINATSNIRLAAGAGTQFPFVIQVQDSEVEKDVPACVRFEVDVLATHVNGSQHSSTPVTVRLRCRRSDQSALLSFIDADGSVGVAAVLRPRTNTAKTASLPIVVSMSGVGVEPQGQADAYKSKDHPKDAGDYKFGFDEMWVLVPHRGGPHNWEDVGMRSALRAIDVLAAAPVTPSADSQRLVVHGHSRGGHGAWGLATRIPDRVLGVASACGWYSREEYGDANNLWIHETSLMHLDKVLLGLLHASIAENENSLHASNLRGMQAMVRVGSKDAAVSPWFGRRMARHLHEEGANVTFEEFDKEHWWWDTLETNDGGVMHDRAMRKWTLGVVKTGIPSLSSVLESGDFTLVASGPEYVGRFGLRILQRSAPSSRGSIRIRRSGDRIVLQTANVWRIGISAGSSIGTEMGGTTAVDGSIVQFDVEGGVELCRVGVGSGIETCSATGLEDRDRCVTEQRGPHWRACTEQSGRHELSRNPSLLGPIRKVFSKPWIVVVPDEPSPHEIQLAAYFATGHLIAVDTATQTLEFSDAQSLRLTHRFVFLGQWSRFPESVRSRWPIKAAAGAIGDALSEEVGLLSVGSCVFGAGHGAVFLSPAGEGAGYAHLLDLVVTGTDYQALEDLVSFSFATNQAHTRAPMSNMLPDFLVSGPEFRWRGYGGVVAAGYWDAKWQIAAQSAYLHC
eukprot:TRINITY_DN43727_c0_g1_i1.p1 TRINITY_DN43727_c0_g1~~TRINITY_DN43727_c0_g1_i1.p1  ORF type:complete len:986 (-),score=93.86 TRINITY_DN43727_c0_g1_i1:212-3052(-)